MTAPRLLLILLIFAGAAAGLFFALGSGDGPRTSSQSSEPVPIGGPFTLVSHEGKTVHDSDFRGKYMLIYFGYTYCPDVCPVELTKMTRALNSLEEKSVPLDAVQPLFITIDPERDTVDQMKKYISLFHPKLIGLTGTTEQVKQATDAYRIYAKKSGDTSSTEYLMDHASMVLLMGKDGAFIDFFSARESADDIANTLGDLLG